MSSNLCIRSEAQRDRILAQINTSVDGRSTLRTEFVSLDRAARLVDDGANEQSSNSVARSTGSANPLIAFDVDNFFEPSTTPPDTGNLAKC